MADRSILAQFRLPDREIALLNADPGFRCVYPTSRSTPSSSPSGS
jgi:hypothetical protein